MGRKANQSTLGKLNVMPFGYEDDEMMFVRGTWAGAHSQVWSGIMGSESFTLFPLLLLLSNGGHL